MTGVATAERTLHTTEVHQPPESNQGHQEAAEHVQPVAEPFAIVTLVDHAHHDGGEQREHPSYTVPSEPRISQVVQSPSAKRYGVAGVPVAQALRMQREYSGTDLLSQDDVPGD